MCTIVYYNIYAYNTHSRFNIKYKLPYTASKLTHMLNKHNNSITIDNDFKDNDTAVGVCLTGLIFHINLKYNKKVEFENNCKTEAYHGVISGEKLRIQLCSIKASFKHQN